MYNNKLQHKIFRISINLVVFVVAFVVEFSLLPQLTLNDDGSITFEPAIQKTHAAWYDTDYTYCRELTINSSQVATTTTGGFALYYATTSASLAATSSSGKIEKLDSGGLPVDVVFTAGTDCDGDSGTVLDYYHEDYASTTGEIHSWIEVMDLSSTTDKTILMYYGNSGASDLSDEAGTFGALGEVSVYDLREDPSTSATAVTDSLGTNHGSSTGGMTAADLVNGKVGKALDFEGTDDYINAGSGGSLNISAGSLLFWFKYDDLNSSRSVISKEDASSAGHLTVDIISNSSPASFARKFRLATYPSTTLYETSLTATSTWTHGAVTFNGTNRQEIFFDGTLENSNSSGNTMGANSPDLLIGGYTYDGTNFEKFFDGIIDDVRVYNEVLSDADISTIYDNTNDVDTFWTEGAEESAPAPTPLSLSGTLYSDEGSTQITTGKTIKMAVGTSTVSLHSTTTDSSAGTFHFDISKDNLTATDTEIVIWVDGDVGTKASVVTRLNSDTVDVTGLDLYEDHIIVRHEGSGIISAISTSDMSFYDGDDDSDIQFTASSTISTALTVNSGNELYIWGDKHFIPIGGVIIRGNSASGNDGSLELAGGAGYHGASTSLSIAGNLTFTSSSTFRSPVEGIIFTATTTGKTISVPLDATSTYESIGDVTFNGSGGAWAFNTNATTTDFTIIDGSVTINASVDLTVKGNYINNGTFTNSGTLIMGPSEGYDMNTTVYSGTEHDFTGDITGGILMDLNFSPDGTKLYIGDTSPEIHEYTLSTPWDISASSRTLTDAYTPAINSSNMEVTPDGRYIYISSGALPTITYEHEMTTPWDLTTIGATGVSYSTSEPANLYEIKFSSDGTKFYLAEGNTGGLNENIWTYNLSIPWKVSSSSVTYSHQYNVQSTNPNLQGFDFNQDGTELYIVDRNNDDVSVYTLATPWEISTSSITYVNSPLNVGSEAAVPRGWIMSGNGLYAYMVENVARKVFQYNLSQSSQSLSGTLTGTSALSNLTVAGASTTIGTNASTSNFITNSSATTTMNGALTLDISGNYTNNGTFVASTSEVRFSGTTQQTATGTMTGTSAFYDLNLTNTSQNGTTSQSVIFGNDVTANGTMTMVASTSAQFQAGATSTFQNINWDGVTSVSEVWLRSSVDGTQWTLDVPGTKTIVSNVNVKDSDTTPTSGGVVANNSTNVGNNTNWTFTNGGDVWNSTEWPIYDIITIDVNNIDEALTDFPVYVDLSDLSSSYWATTIDGGGDIRVTTHEDNPTELPREVVSASTTLQTGELHFKADRVSATIDTSFRIYYNGTDIDYATNATNGAEAVWSNGYDAVYHLNEDPGIAGDGEILDSTSNARHGTDVGSMDANDSVSGRIGKAFDFEGNDDTVQLTDIDYSSAPLTVSAWANSSGASTTEQDIIGDYAGGATRGSFITYKGGADAGDTRVGLSDGSKYTSSNNSTQNWTETGWHYVTAVHDASNSTNYTDGVASTSDSHDNTWPTVNTPWYIGSRGDNFVYFNGLIDEVRISSAVRSPEWIKAEYYNQATTTDFYTLTTGTGSSTISNHDSGQVSNAFNFQNKTNEALYAFKITPNTGNATVTQMRFSLTGAKKITVGDFSNLRIYQDVNDDGAYDGGDTQIASAGVMALDHGYENSQQGDIVFTNDFLLTTATNYILVADWSAPEKGSSLKFELKPSGVYALDSAGAVVIDGSVDAIQHQRNNKGGGGNTAQIGGAPPVGDGDVGGGTNEGGEQIGGDPDFFWPTANSGAWTNAANAYDQSDGTYASNAAATDHEYTDYSHGVPGSDSVKGIEVKLELSYTSGSGVFNVELSYDGGTSWTTTKTTPSIATTDTVVTLGGASDLWGRVWTPGELSDANFAVRISGDGANTAQIDAIQVKVYHQASGGGSGGGGGI